MSRMASMLKSVRNKSATAHFGNAVQEALREHDFVIHDEGVAEDFGRFQHADCYHPVEMENFSYISSTFSRHAQIHYTVLWFCSLLDCIFAPLRLSFSRGESAVQTVCQVAEVGYGIGLVHGFFFSTLEGNFENFNAGFIAWSRLRSHEFQVDLISFLCGFVAMVTNGESLTPTAAIILCIGQFLRVWRLLSIPEVYRHRLGKRGLVDLAQLLVFIMLLVHLVACLWYFCTTTIGTFGHHMAKLTDKGVSAEHISHYIVAYHSVWMMFVSDTQPAFSNYEIFMAVGMALMGNVVLAVLLAKIVQILSRMYILAERREEQMACIRQAVSFLGVPRKLASRILEFQKFLQGAHDSLTIETLFSNISGPLSLELKLTLFYDLIAHAPFFASVSANVLKKVVMSLIDQFFQPGDFIIRKGEPASEMYFVVRGVCEILTDLDMGVVRVFYSCNYFGEVALLRGDQNYRTAWVRSAVYTHLTMLTKFDLDDAFAAFPKERENMLERMQYCMHGGDPKDLDKVKFSPEAPTIEIVRPHSTEPTIKKEETEEKKFGKTASAPNLGQKMGKSDSDLSTDEDEKQSNGSANAAHSSAAKAPVPPKAGFTVKLNGERKNPKIPHQTASGRASPVVQSVERHESNTSDPAHEFKTAGGGKDGGGKDGGIVSGIKTLARKLRSRPGSPQQRQKVVDHQTGKVTSVMPGSLDLEVLGPRLEGMQGSRNGSKERVRPQGQHDISQSNSVVASVLNSRACSRQQMMSRQSGRHGVIGPGGSHLGSRKNSFTRIPGQPFAGASSGQGSSSGPGPTSTLVNQADLAELLLGIQQINSVADAGFHELREKLGALESRVRLNPDWWKGGRDTDVAQPPAVAQPVYRVPPPFLSFVPGQPPPALKPKVPEATSPLSLKSHEYGDEISKELARLERESQ